MKIEFYGVRGSYPVPGKDTIIFGGNTTCVSISTEVNGKIKRLIFDCGTGVISLGKDILKNHFAQKEDLNILMFFTHLHPDHTQGFPFFAPNYFGNCNLSLFGFKTLKKHIGMVLEQEMLPPTFPIEYKDLKSKRNHYELKDADKLYISYNKYNTEKMIDSIFMIDCMQGFAPSHPQQGALYYKVTELKTGKSISCIWDIESHIGGDRRVINFIKNSDILIHDTQYTTDEYNSDKIIIQGFGHSTYEMAIENAVQGNVKELWCMHYNPNHTDEKLQKIGSDYNYINDTNVIIKLAREYMAVEM